ncbi:hypothetical protein V2T44_04015 [Serratia ficaria]|uniref:hypothetical protein n=1 Tax=Serratia TaxID=613 RepID=UPI001013D147|nr:MULTISPECIES: hypothetical protein [Serratia]MEE4482133.1 hypothetical protein [Serratia ficaria]CAI0709897.1 Uncharacterised protein [Serratia ficaria]CAI0754215.1 Uncharacterised protein [Serratia ficaria]CAI1840115.1 Uncharacterised protein [Serratia ficaria]CAI2110824.1 Uncharacterised protein [Serratia ficaria]
MTKAVKIVSVAVAAVLIFAAYKTASIALTDSADYTRSDWLTYKLIAPDEIKGAPLLVDETPLHFRATDGNSPQVDEVEYGKGTDETVLADYLVSLGYHQVDDPVFGKRWAKEGSDKSAYIAKTDNAVRLTFTD